MNKLAECTTNTLTSTVSSGVCGECGCVVQPVKLYKTDYQPALCSACQNKYDIKQKRREKVKAYQARLIGSRLPKNKMGISTSFKSGEALADMGLADAKAFRACQVWEYGPSGLYLFGSKGSGKTFLAQCMLKEQAWLGRCGFFLDLPVFFTEIKQSFSMKDNTVYADWIDRAKRYAFLVMDDIGSEKPSDWSREIIVSILNVRMGKGLPTVITSNYDLKSLEQHLGDAQGRIPSRIAEYCQPIRVGVSKDGAPVDLRVEIRKTRN